MKNIFALIFISILWTNSYSAYPIPNHFPPFRIIGNVYYVGTDDLASYLIVTPKGNILINSNLKATVPMLKASIEKLGFKFSDTKILLISHAHQDHVEGSKLIQDKTHAQYMVMNKDVPLIKSGGKSDFQYGNDPTWVFPIAKVDKVLHDGDQIKLGNTTLTAHLTAGHTPGCTTWAMDVMDHGKLYHVVFVGSLSVNPGYQLINNKKYPEIARDYKHAIQVLKSLPCDIFLGAHAGYFDLKKKYALLGKSTKNPFIDHEGYENYIAQHEEEYHQALVERKE